MRWVLAATVVAMTACGRTEPVEFRDAVARPIDGGVDAGGACPISIDAVRSATIGVTADDQRTVWLNGALVADTTAMWFDPSTHDAQVFRHPARKNVLAILGTNLQTIPTLDRGVLASLTAGSGVLVTDTSWRFANGQGANLEWTQPAFDDSAWRHPVDEGANGVQPWGFFPDIDPRAHWLWSYASGGVPNKPDVEPVRFRRAFYVLLDGGISDVPGACP